MEISVFGMYWLNVFRLLIIVLKFVERLLSLCIKLLGRGVVVLKLSFVIECVFFVVWWIG